VYVLTGREDVAVGDMLFEYSESTLV